MSKTKNYLHLTAIEQEEAELEKEYRAKMAALTKKRKKAAEAQRPAKVVGTVTLPTVPEANMSRAEKTAYKKNLIALLFSAYPNKINRSGMRKLMNCGADTVDEAIDEYSLNIPKYTQQEN